MNDQENRPEPGGDPKEVGIWMIRTVAWFAEVVGVALVIALCVMGIFQVGLVLRRGRGQDG